jgi:EmrB/QacA subfamily drug resistance transporter
MKWSGLTIPPGDYIYLQFFKRNESMNDQLTRNTALALATISSFTTPFLMSSINVALPTIGRLFEMHAVVLSWVATSYVLSSVVFLVPFGRLADIYGRKRILMWGYVIFTLSNLICGLSNSAFTLILFRVIQGIGSAMVFATSMAIIVSVFPPRERGRALGITVAAVYFGLSAGPFLGGLITEHLSWRGVFLVNVPLGLILIYLTVFRLKGEWAEAKGEEFDLTGSIIYGIGLVAMIYGLTLLPTVKGAVLIVIGIIGILFFIKWVGRVEHPVFDLRLFKRNRVFALSNLTALISYSATSALAFLLSLYLQHIKALSPQDAGLVLIAQPIVQAVVSPFSGRLSDRIEPRIVASSGMIFITFGLFLLTFLGENTGYRSILTALIILGFGFALFSSPNTNAVMSSVERRFLGLASGSIGTMRMTGSMISMGIATLVFTLFLGEVQITSEVHPAFMKAVKTAFIIFTVLCFGGIFASLGRGRLRSGNGSSPG